MTTGLNSRIKEFYEKFVNNEVTLETSCIEEFFDINKHRKEKVASEPTTLKIEFISFDSIEVGREYGNTSVLLSDFYSNICDLTPKLSDELIPYENLEVDKAYLTREENALYLNIVFEPETRMETDGEVIIRLKNTILRLYEQEELKKKKIDNFINSLTNSELNELKKKINNLEE